MKARSPEFHHRFQSRAWVGGAGQSQGGLITNLGISGPFLTPRSLSIAPSDVQEKDASYGINEKLGTRQPGPKNERFIDF